MKMEKIWLFQGDDRVGLEVEVADDALARIQGLSNRDAHEVNGAGMLFKYPAPVSRSYTMKETRIPLCIAWFDEFGRLLGQVLTQPFQVEPVASPGLYRYVLEFPAGTEPKMDAGTRLRVLS